MDTPSVPEALMPLISKARTTLDHRRDALGRAASEDFDEALAAYLVASARLIALNDAGLAMTLGPDAVLSTEGQTDAPRR